MPEQFGLNSGVSVNQNVAHTNDIIPRNLGVFSFEFQRQHISGLSYYFNVLDNGEIAQLVRRQFFLRKALCKGYDIIGSLENVLQSPKSRSYSLINKYFILVDTLLGKWLKAASFHHVNPPPQLGFQLVYHFGIL